MQENSKYPLRENFFVGENPADQDPTLYDNNVNINYDELIQLPEFIAKIMPSYLLGCGECLFNPETKQIILDIRFDKKFEMAFKNFYNIQREITTSEICEAIRIELEKIYKNL